MGRNIRRYLPYPNGIVKLTYSISINKMLMVLTVPLLLCFKQNTSTLELFKSAVTISYCLFLLVHIKTYVKKTNQKTKQKQFISL